MKLPGAPLRYFFRNLSSRCSDSFGFIMIFFIVVLFRNNPFRVNFYIEVLNMALRILCSRSLLSGLSMAAMLFIPSALVINAT